MGPEGGRQNPPLGEGHGHGHDAGSGGGGALLTRLLAEPHAFDFFQAVRVLERAAGAMPVGRDHAPDAEAVRLRAQVSLAIPHADITDARDPAAAAAATTAAAATAAIADATTPDLARRPGRRRPVELSVGFMGLAGPHGALPRHYTSLLLDRVRNKDFALRDFLDLFNHRLLSLFYRAWEKVRLPVSCERARRQQAQRRPDDPAVPDDPITAALYALVGLGTGGLRGRIDAGDEAILHYAGAYAHFPRNAASLAQLVGDFFGLPARVEQFVGQWLYLSPDSRSRLPTPPPPRIPTSAGPGQTPVLPPPPPVKPAGNRIGIDTVLGERVWDVQGKFRVRLGPLNYEQFCRFIPGGDALPKVASLVRLYAGPEYDFDVQPVLRKDCVPRARLGAPSTGPPPMLGRNIWTSSLPFDKDFEGATFSPDTN